MTLHLHRADRSDRLADGLADLLARPLPDPFAEEVVVVPAKGVERWLTQRLSHRLGVGDRGGDGVCAGVRFVNPRSLVTMLTGLTGPPAGAGGAGHGPGQAQDPWDPDVLVWPLLETIDAGISEAAEGWCEPLARHLGAFHLGVEAELRRNRRWAVARRLAGLFATYATQRPSLVTDWREGGSGDGAGAALPPDLAWQPELWRRLLERVDAPPPDVRHAEALAAIRAGRPLALPDRLSLFGHTRLPVTEVELLRAVGEVREVHLWLPQPSPALWRSLAESLEESSETPGPVRRRDDRSGLRVHHPLLSSLGRDSRELQRSLASLTAECAQDELLPGSDPAPTTLLAMLQHDLRADAPPAPATRDARRLESGDRSVQLHACHGPARQVEVLREVLVGLLDDDPTLEPRDIVVMCPDVERYAPLFSASFGLAGVVPDDVAHPAHRLRVRLADRGLRGTNPLLAVAGRLVDLAGGRATATEVLDLATAEPVSRRFGLGEDDLATVTSWVEQVGVRWGLSAELRAPYSVRWGQNTWRAGLDRLLLGVAMAEEEGRWLGGALPLDDVASASVDLAGRLGELVDRVETCVLALDAAVSAQDWVLALTEGVHGLCATTPEDAWQRAQLDRELATVAASAAAAGAPRLGLADLRALLELRLEGRPTRANFRTGTLTVATLVPMRSVPHRVVCLVGLDDGVFPRQTTADGDDALARDPLTGERDARSEDRQLLLDAVLAATETLVVTWTGANEHNGQERPPAVPLGELRDALALTATAPAGGSVRDQVEVRHPLQPFDPRNFAAGALGAAGPFSFDERALAGARASRRERTAPDPFAAPFLPVALPPLPPARSRDVALEDLKAFVAHPARAFLRQRLEVSVPRDHDELLDAMPVELDNLEQWALGDRVLRRAIGGDDPDSVFTAELLRGELPPGNLGDRVLEGVTGRVNALYQRSAPEREHEPRTVQVLVDLGGGRRLTGSVPDVRRGRIVRVHYGSLSAKHRLASWVDLLALSAADPDHSWTAFTAGWHGRTGSPQCSLMGPVDHRALALLGDLADLRERGLREPLPLPVKTASAWADRVRTGGDDRAARSGAQSSWDGRFSPERDEREHERVWGRRAPFDVLLGEPGEDERWSDQRTRLGQYALRLWAPLFEHERVGS